MSIEGAKPQPIQIRDGMTVKDVKTSGTEAQKLAAGLFDKDNNGIYDKGEANLFNQYDIVDKPGEFKLYNNNTKETIIIKYKDRSNLEEVLNARYNMASWVGITLSEFDDPNSPASTGFGSPGTVAGETVMDLENNTVKMSGYQGDALYARGDEVTITDCEVEQISARGDKVTIKNCDNAKGIQAKGKTVTVKDCTVSKLDIDKIAKSVTLRNITGNNHLFGLIKTSTDVSLPKSANLDCDNNSRVDIERQ